MGRTHGSDRGPGCHSACRRHFLQNRENIISATSNTEAITTKVNTSTPTADTNTRMDTHGSLLRDTHVKDEHRVSDLMRRLNPASIWFWARRKIDSRASVFEHPALNDRSYYNNFERLHDDFEMDSMDDMGGEPRNWVYHRRTWTRIKYFWRIRSFKRYCTRRQRGWQLIHKQVLESLTGVPRGEQMVVEQRQLDWYLAEGRCVICPLSSSTGDEKLQAPLELGDGF